MKVSPTALPGVVVIEPKVFGDERGFLLEPFEAKRFEAAGLPARFVLDLWSRSARGTLRGLHYQWPTPQAKLVYATAGAVLDVAVDVRRGSPTFGQHVAVELSVDNRRQLFIPEGFAHGFCVLTESADLQYKVSAPYAPEHEHSVLWSDPALNIAWPAIEPRLLSKKDEAGKLLGQAALPPYEPR